MNNLKNPLSETQDWVILSSTISLWTTLVLKLNGIKVNKIKLGYKEIYRKYVGNDYVFNQKEKYSLTISIYLIQN